MSVAYFNVFARQQERNRRRLREKLVRQRTAVSGQQSAGRHLTPALSPDEAEREKTAAQQRGPTDADGAQGGTR